MHIGMTGIAIGFGFRKIQIGMAAFAIYTGMLSTKGEFSFIMIKAGFFYDFPVISQVANGTIEVEFFPVWRFCTGETNEKAKKYDKRYFMHLK